MIFDGSSVELGDSMYDLAYGPGVVTELDPAHQVFRVTFGKRMFTYTLAGVGNFQRKTLFWREPIGGFYPTKNDAIWDKFTQIRQSVSTILNG